jgi:taurine dioxygenase
MSLQICPLSYALGAEVTGIDIRNPLDDNTFREVHTAFLEYCVLLFRGQPLTQEQHIAFSRRFGEVDHKISAERILRDDGSLPSRIPKYPEILMNKSPANAALVWHSDRSFTLVPAMASLLRGIELPEVGGDTMFSNMYLAYETLSEGMKKLIASVDAVHPGAKSRLDDSTPERLAETKRLNPPVAQPLVRVHPETGRKSLFVEEKVKQLVGMTSEESGPLIRFLCEHAARPQFVYRHVWQKGDLIMWDNRCTNHIAVGDFDRTRIRHTEKTCVRGTPSGYVYDGPVEVSHY